MSVLTATQISARLRALPHWKTRRQALRRTFTFDGFLQSIDFVNRIARKAQTLNHHPAIDIRYNKVTLTLTTHEQGGITRKDFTLAHQCEAVMARHFA